MQILKHCFEPCQSVPDLEYLKAHQLVMEIVLVIELVDGNKSPQNKYAIINSF